MRHGRLIRKLQQLHAAPAKGRDRDRRALETDLVARYRTLHPHRRAWLNMLNPWNRIARSAVAGGAMILLVVGACSETTTTVALGAQLQIGLRAEGGGLVESGDPQQQVDAVLTWLAGRHGVDDAHVNLQKGEMNGQTTASLDVWVWGEGVDTDQLVADLRARFPELAGAEITVDDLNTVITESWAERLCRDYLHIDIGGATAEEVRAKISEQIAAQGMTDYIQVDRSTDGQWTTVEIKATEKDRD